MSHPGHMQRHLESVGRGLATALLLLALACGAPAAPHQHRDPHDFGDVQRSIQMFEAPDRAKWQKPDQCVKALGLKPGQVVADIGASTGYFARRLARAVGPEGRVLALDIEASLVAYMADRARKENQPNLEARVVAPDDPGLSPASVDLVLIVDTVHHIEQRPAYYGKIKAGLKPGGRLAIIDWRDKKTPFGPPIKMRISKSAMIKELSDAGYRLVEDIDFLPYQYFLIFKPSQR